ncbi:MAG TPA: DUF4445 domain-containing protein, partial [Nitrospirae bacterium]|nr:DUF4445 domain-containing protein [Nitrospirota bacterium]
MEHNIIFQPSGRRAKVPHGTTILNAARKLGVGIEAVCGDNLTCGKCKVKIMEGEFPKEGITSSLSHVTRIEEKDKKIIKDLTAEISSAKSDEQRQKLERKLAKIRKKHQELASEEVDENIRLSCATRVMGDVLVFVPEASRTAEQIVSKAAGKIDVKIDPAVKKYYMELTAPELSDPVGDLERIEAALKEHKIENITIDYSVLQQVPDILRESDWKVTVTVLYNREIIKIEPGKAETNIGIAVDIGTTTVAGYLTDLNTGEVLATESMMNPQVSFGEDVMSRITYCLLNEQSG